MNRRDFLKAAAAAGIVAGLPSAARGATGGTFKTKLEKALIAQVADDVTCERIVKAGFSGVELTKKGVTFKQAIEGRRTAEKHGLRIHSLMSGGADFNNPDPDARKRSLDVMTERIQVAAASGASTMLLVPCRVNGQMPAPTQFSIDFDPQTLHVRTVVKGGNAPFSAYIDAQNRSTNLTREFVEKLIPVAAREGVIIALENVWDNLWVTIEENGYSDAEYSAIMDRFFAGQALAGGSTS
ncbi:MAG: TIM barrel protein [Kiritimatiellae bacterium]|nr:TIM barrel protein [Kiritimatiellia bacterium]